MPRYTTDRCNAPASEASGTWVRVAQAWAGANWGGAFIPRLGQEVVVAFLDGDIDRPLPESWPQRASLCSLT